MAAAEEFGSGCYLTFEEASGGVLFLNWSKERVPNALAYFNPTKNVPAFKFTAHGGKSELIRECAGPKVKRFYEGVTQFVKLAREFQASFHLLNEDEFHLSNMPLQVVLHRKESNAVERCTLKQGYTLADVGAVAALHKAASALEVQTMTQSMFVAAGESHGAGLSF
mmetsp:Transcript_7394/g.16370  ORF Transcript_7394/g.16370 Transcript_7394/m.16370 type:complete len:167 (+) Transcript_7394:3-503(+)